MVYVKYQQANQVITKLAAALGGSAGDISVVLDVGTGDIMPVGTPYILTIQKRVDGVVTKREGVRVTSRSGDVLTVERGFITTVGSDKEGEPGYQTQGNLIFSFDPEDEVYLGIAAEQLDDIQEEIDTKVSKEELQDGSVVFGASSTGNDDYAITLDPAPDTLEVGSSYRFSVDVGNTGPATLNINGLGAVSIKKLTDQDLQTGDIIPGQIVEVSYDGTNFQMSSQISNIPVFAADHLLRDFTAGEALNIGDALYIESADGKVYKTQADDTAKLDFIGVSQATVALDDTVSVRISGIDGNQSGLTTAEAVYLSDTPGLVQTTSGTNSIIVGRAVNTNTFKMVDDPELSKSAFTKDSIVFTLTPGGNFSNPGDTLDITYSHSLGVLPTRIDFSLKHTSSNIIKESTGTRTVNGNNVVYLGDQSNFGGDQIVDISSSYCLYWRIANASGGSGETTIRGQVLSVTDTDFTIRWDTPNGWASLPVGERDAFILASLNA